MTPETGSFEYMDNFINKAKKITPEYYREVNRIVDSHLNDFIKRYGRKANLIDVGGAGVLSYDVNLLDKICVMDIFQKPDKLILPGNVKWIVQNILDENIADKQTFDIVILSGVLHHLAERHNNIRRNIKICLENVNKLLVAGGSCLIFESICPPYFDKIQDLLYPVYSKILTRMLKFPYARLLSLKEVTETLQTVKFKYRMLDFKQSKHHYFAGYKLSSKVYPISYVCVKIMNE